jgi:site-specific DNA recombinase
MNEINKRDARIARTLELESIIEVQGGNLIDFSDDLYMKIVENIATNTVVKFSREL